MGAKADVTKTGPEHSGAKGANSDEALQKIANYLDRDVAGLHTIFGIHEGVPRLTVKASRLPSSISAAATDIALLLMAARQGAGVDDFTSDEVLRAEAARYSKYDKTNFAKSFKPLTTYVQTQGKRGSISRKLTQPGIEAAAAKVAEYVNATSA